MSATTAACYRHEALLYDGLQGFLDGVVPFLRDAVRAGEPTLVVVDAVKIERLRDALGPDAGAVAFADMAQVGANPARIIPAWQDFLDEHAGRPVRGVGEPIHPGRGVDELIECQRHEALLNLAFAEVPGFWLLCPYDVQALPAPVLDEACRTHPWVAPGGPSELYTGNGLAPLSEPLAEPRRVEAELAFDGEGLSALRIVVASRARDAGLSESRTADVVLAVGELAANSVRHGGGRGVLRTWTDASTFLCEIRDGGRIDEPLIGRVRPKTSQTGGRGVWIANQLCDLVQVRCLDDGGVVRVHMRR